MARIFFRTNFMYGPVVFVFVMACFHGVVGPLPERIKFGGIFVKDSTAEQAYRFAVDRINSEKEPINDVELVPVVEHVEGEDSYDAYKKGCKILSHRGGVAAIFGPTTTEGHLAIEGICDQVDVPHVVIRWEHEQRDGHLAVNLHPHNRYISQLLSDIVDAFAWTKMTIIYQESEALLRLHHVLEGSRGELTIRQLTGGNLNVLLKEIKRSGTYNVIFDCKQEMLAEVLERLLELQMLQSHYRYIFTSMDLCLMDMSRYSGDAVNITSIHLMNMRSKRVLTTRRSWHHYHALEGVLNNETAFTTEAALMFDAVNVAKRGLHLFGRTQNVSTEQLSCGQVDWSQGRSYFNALKMVDMPEGITGEIRFDMHGERDNPIFFISELGPYGMEQVGTWNGIQGLEFTRTVEEFNISSVNRTLRVVTVLENPYVMFRVPADGTELHGNDQFEGYCIDLLAEIAKEVGFEYEIHLVRDGNYGNEVSDGKWNGMIGELMEGEADLAVAPLTITYVREQVVDFSKPFMHLGITILYRVPEPQNPGVFSFLNPLSFDIWMYVVISFLVVALTMFLIARFSPYEWYNEHPCNPEYDKVENQFNLLSCIWFAFGGLMQQGSEVNPRAFSTRVLSGFWWFF